MFIRALIAFLTLPMLVAFVAPWLLLSLTSATIDYRFISILMILLGCVGLIWCVRDFYVQGKGTLAPWSPPSQIVIVGLYRIVRNPMYISVIMILVGWCLLTSSPAIAVYTLVVGLSFHVRVLNYEEPWLSKTFGSSWKDYSRRVNRWLPWPAKSE